MPRFLVQATYTADGLKGLQKDTATGRRAAVARAVERLGGKLESFYFTLGEHDVMAIAELPDSVTAAGFAMKVSATGLVRTKTTALLTVDEADQALRKSVSYEAPGTRA
jgi:uncharacterized protein with GYD domain